MIEIDDVYGGYNRFIRELISVLFTWHEEFQVIWFENNLICVIICLHVRI